MSSCTQQPVTLPLAGDRWKYQDLRALADPTAHIMIAAYARQTQTDLEFRADLLNPQDLVDSRMVMALDIRPGGSQLSFAPEAGSDWDLLVSIPFGRLPQVTSLGGPLPGDLRARVVHEPSDSVIVRLSSRLILQNLDSQWQDNFRFITFVTSANATEVKDSLGPILFDAAPPPQAPLLLAFWDTLPAMTPAQALRRWNGAHTGPYGQRHGLRILLETARREKVPVVLLDLKRPQQLAVLPLLDGQDQVQEMQQDGLIILPDQAVGDLSKQSGWLSSLERVQSSYVLPGSPLVYGTTATDLRDQYSGAFAWLNDPNHIANWNNTRLIPLPEPQDGAEITESGLTAHTKTRLLQTALSLDPDDLLVLGGSLPRSPWGDLINVGPSFEYISNHPWIKVLDQNALMAIPARSGQPHCADLLCMSKTRLEPEQEALRSTIDLAPPGPFTDLARQTYLNLTEPQTDERLAALKSIYLGDVAYLIRAAQWAAAPMALSTCSENPDLNAASECLLASKQVFLILAPNGGRLVFAAVQTASGPVQIIGPRSQLAVGLGDARDWDLENSLAADPQEIAGAFGDEGPSEITPDTLLPYQVDLKPSEITFTHPDTGLQKKFLLSPDGFQVEVNTTTPVDYLIPLILLDDRFFQPGWLNRYQAASPTSSGWTWGLEEGPCTHLAVTGAEMTASSFIQSRSLLKESENPDLAYPDGHFLPFPMALVELHAQGDFSLTLRVAPFQENFAGLALGSSCVQQP